MKNCFKFSVVALTLIASSTTFAQTFPKATLYKDANCGCCVAYVDYLKKNKMNVTSVNRTDMGEIKKKYGSNKAASCHTMRIGGYTVEGHVPVAAIKKLLNEKPDIVGISVPGMPMNSPGMGPEKKGTLKVMALTKDGQTKPFSVE